MRVHGVKKNAQTKREGKKGLFAAAALFSPMSALAFQPRQGGYRKRKSLCPLSHPESVGRLD